MSLSIASQAASFILTGRKQPGMEDVPYGCCTQLCVLENSELCLWMAGPFEDTQLSSFNNFLSLLLLLYRPFFFKIGIQYRINKHFKNIVFELLSVE